MSDVGTSDLVKKNMRYLGCDETVWDLFSDICGTVFDEGTDLESFYMEEWGIDETDERWLMLKRKNATILSAASVISSAILTLASVIETKKTDNADAIRDVAAALYDSGGLMADKLEFIGSALPSCDEVAVHLLKEDEA